MLSFMATTRI